jgi:hypothetical protein
MMFDTVLERGNYFAHSEVDLDPGRIVGWKKSGFDQEKQQHRWRPILDNGVTLDIEVTQASVDAWRDR